MAVSTTQKPVGLTASRGDRGDKIFKGATVVFAGLIILLVLAFAVILIINSGNSISKSGLSFLTSSDWSTDNDHYGAWVFIYDTVVTSVIALILGGLVSLGVAIFLSEYAPGWLRTPISFVVELLAAIPSVIFGLWGVAVLGPIMGGTDKFLFNSLGFVPMFGGGFDGTAPEPLANGRNLLTAGIVLSIMIIPTVASISRDVLSTVPANQREGMLALGATKWQTIRRAVLPAGQRGIIGALILGFGRAVGETVAVSYLVGGAQNNIPPSGQILDTGETISTKIANSRSEALGTAFSAIIELGLVLFVLTLLVNGLALWLVNRGVKTNRSKNTPNPVGKWVARLLFPVVVLILFPYLSLPVSLGIVVLWGLYQALKNWDVRTQEAGRKLPKVLAILAQPQISFGYRKSMNSFMSGLMIFATLLAVVPLASILGLVIIQGISAFVQPDFLTATQDGRNILDQAKQVASGKDGIANAILGTLSIVGLASLIGIPIGILSGIYLSEYGDNRFGQIVRFTANALNSIPSIIIGLFGLAVFVNNHIFAENYSGWAGVMVLAIMMIPLITRNTEEVLRLVPVSLREAALGLGLPQWKVTLTMVLPAATSAIVTGILLGVARIAGETAPLLLTASTSSNWRNPMSGPTTALTTYIYANISGDPEQQAKAWGAALTIVIIIFILVFGIRFLTRSRLRTSL
jgi:phosphate transport system permease protein